MRIVLQLCDVGWRDKVMQFGGGNVNAQIINHEASVIGVWRGAEQQFSAIVQLERLQCWIV
jgi:hypothetical protein